MTASNGRIGVGIVGARPYRGWSNNLARACKANPHAEVVGLAEIQEGAAEKFAELHEIDVQTFSDYRDMLAMDGLDAVYIATPNNLHAPIAIAAAQAGKHVLCQKPMATTLADAEAMVAAAEKANVRGMVCYTKRFFKATRFLYDFLRSEDLGRLYHVRAFYYQSWLSNPNTPVVWRLKREATGTGALGDLGSHVTDLAQYLVADDITRVTGMMKTFVTERPSLADPNKKETVDVDDAVIFCAEFKGGAMGVVQASRNATGRPDHWRIEIDAENGAIVYDNLEPNIKLNLQKGPARHAGWVDLPVPNRYGDNTYENEVGHFIDCIRSGETPSPSLADGLKTERVMDAVVRSCRTGTAVDV